MKEQITYDIFDKVDIRIGTVISVKKNEKAKKPSLVIEADFGKEIGIKQSSAQITHYYNEDNLKGKQVVGVCNFPEKNIAGIKSQFLVSRCYRRRWKSDFTASISTNQEWFKNSISHYDNF